MMSGHPVPYYKSFKMNAIVGMFWREKHGLRIILTINQGKTIKTVINTEKSDIMKLLSPRDDFIAVQKLITNAKYGNKEILPELHVIQEGSLSGFISINPRWSD